MGKMLLSNISSWICCKIVMLLGNKKLSWPFVRAGKWWVSFLSLNCFSGRQGSQVSFVFYLPVPRGCHSHLRVSKMALSAYLCGSE